MTELTIIGTLFVFAFAICVSVAAVAVYVGEATSGGATKLSVQLCASAVLLWAILFAIAPVVIGIEVAA